MNPDISKLMSAWPYETGRIVARMIVGDDASPKIQVRLDLGIIQMNADGRPDGQRPFGFESLLEYYEHQASGPERADSGSRPPAERRDDSDEDPTDDPDETSNPRRGKGSRNDEGLRLGADDCRMLREEAAQYYQRYLALLALEDYDRVIRDTTRNLRVLDFCQSHAEADDDRAVLEQFRPYITLARTRALASRALTDNEPKAALYCIDEGLDAMKKHFVEAGQPQAFEDSEEVRMLRQLRDSLLPKLPMSQHAELRERLARAIQQENYELAAILRDELRQLKDDSPPPSAPPPFPPGPPGAPQGPRSGG
ncbi:MAG: UvrB/UvrC motif-containing protein [Phycisphaerales bacterium]